MPRAAGNFDHPKTFRLILPVWQIGILFLYILCAHSTDHPLVRVRACMNFSLALCSDKCSATSKECHNASQAQATRAVKTISEHTHTHTDTHVCVCVFRPFKMYSRLFLASLKMPSKYVGQSKAKQEENRKKETPTIFSLGP